MAIIARKESKNLREKGSVIELPIMVAGIIIGVSPKMEPTT